MVDRTIPHKSGERLEGSTRYISHRAIVWGGYMARGGALATQAAMGRDGGKEGPCGEYTAPGEVDYHEDPIPSFWEGEAAVAGLGGRRREAQRRSAGGLGSAPAISNPAVAARIYHDDVLDNPHPICFLDHSTTANQSSAVAQPWLPSASS